MADNKNIRDNPDRNQVAGNEEYEVGYVAKQHGVSEDKVRKAIKGVGNDREKISLWLSKHSR